MRIGIISLGRHSVLRMWKPSLEEVVFLPRWHAETGSNPSEYSKCDAIAVLGEDQRKVHYVKRALLAGKHVFADFPLGTSFRPIRQLREIASRKQICFFSPNLMRNMLGVEELRHKRCHARSELLSLTVACSVPGPYETTRLEATMLRLLDLVEWVADSKCTNVLGHKSGDQRNLRACTLLASLKSGTMVLMNLCFDSGCSETMFWADGIFDDSIVHVDPSAQSVRVRLLDRETERRIYWGKSPLSLALEDFVVRIERKEREDLEDYAHLFSLLTRMSLR